MSYPLPAPTILPHQTQQHHAVGFADAPLLAVIHLGQMDSELEIGPLSGWRSLGGRRVWFPPWGVRRRERTQGKSLGRPREGAAGSKWAWASFPHSVASTPSFPSPPPLPHTGRHILWHPETLHGAV